MSRILIVDDEFNMRVVLEALLKKEGYEVSTASDGVEALKILAEEEVSVVVTDLKMPKLDGMGLLDRIMENYPSIPVIMITAHGTVSNAVDALKKGAFDYITKPFEQADLKHVIAKAVKTSALSEEEILPGTRDSDWYGIVGDSEGIVKVREAIQTVAPTQTTVLITGETGTGKELVARAVHKSSLRKDHPFIKINCAAIPEHLMESELFGYEKGAFTGAVFKKPGRFELAHKGTLFLDEIGELPKAMQVKLLQVIQDQEFERVGGLRTIKVDVRLVAATNQNLVQQVKDGQFREDLFYRLNVFPIHIPPLRDRQGDILTLVQHFVEKFNQKLSRSVHQLAPEAQALFLDYPWPGNVREIENLMERLILIAKGDTIYLEDIPEEFRAPEEKLLSSRGNGDGKSFKDIIREHTEEVEKEMIQRVLEECEGNVTRAAHQLGVSRKGLQLKMIKYNLRK